MNKDIMGEIKIKKKQARIAGFWYLLMAIIAAFGILYPMNILVPNDPTATANNIINSEWVYRLCMLSNVVGQTIFIFLALAFKNLFEGINPKLSKMLVALVIVAVPIAIFNTINMMASLLILDGSEYLQAFNQNQLNALSLFFLNLYQFGLIIVQIFWGLWLLPLGLLSIQSKYIPKWIGILLIIGCVSYVIIVVVGFLCPQYNESVSSVLMIPLALGEFSIIGWLLAKGVKE